MKITARWHDLPVGIRNHLDERLVDRSIDTADLKRLGFWLASRPEVPEGDWFKDFGKFKICGTGSVPKTFLNEIQIPFGEEVE